MANWARNHTELFAGRRVVELGSGTGMLGVSLLKAGLGMQGRYSILGPILTSELGSPFNRDACIKIY